MKKQLIDIPVTDLQAEAARLPCEIRSHLRTAIAVPLETLAVEALSPIAAATPEGRAGFMLGAAAVGIGIAAENGVKAVFKTVRLQKIENHLELRTED